jgi:hypothetical protein
MRSPVRVQVHDEIPEDRRWQGPKCYKFKCMMKSKGDKDRSVTKEHPRGLKCKDQTSCERTLYLGRED